MSMRTTLRPLSEDDLSLFIQGKDYRIYNKLGAHPGEIDGVSGTRFAVWAPNAKSVSVIGDFNGWDANTKIFFFLL